MKVSKEEFDRYVREAIEQIDPAFRVHLEVTPVIVDDLADAVVCRKMKLRRRDQLLGLFRGVPLNRRTTEGLSGPNQIVLYRQSILSRCRTRAQLACQIRKTIMHELGHYLGFSERQLRRYE